MMPKEARQPRTTVLSRSANSGHVDFGLFCNPESRRVEGFCGALGRILRQRPKLVPWLFVLTDPAWQERLEPVPRFLRLESPGRNWAVERHLLLRGAETEDAEASPGWRRISKDQISTLVNDPGRIHPMRQWFLGWRRTLEELKHWSEQRGFDCRWLCPPDDVLCMFDKNLCHRVLANAGIAVPPLLGIPGSFDELWEMMRRAGRRRVFLKPCHGSSASGVVALETSARGIQAFSALEWVKADGELRLYNRRRIVCLRSAAEVRQIVDAVCGERCVAEVWIPKAAISTRPFDLRVVVVGGRARHVKVRLGRGPITNSLLLGGQGEAEAVRRRMGEEAWSRMLTMCEQAAMCCFPRTLYAGFDVLVEPDFKRSHVLEVNAFGDLLPATLHEGRDTYTWEIEEALHRKSVQVSATGA